MELPSEQTPIPPSPKCKLSLHIDGCCIGFTSRTQYNRFIRMRTYLGKDGYRHMINHIIRTQGKYYCNGEVIDDKKAKYFMTKNYQTAREAKAEEEKRLLEDAQFYASGDENTE